ncbi:MAG: transglutaminase-like cysteine peptidase [Methylobacterium mesophilicum]|nr:transglutaminase-like cysteine peptidase [Methylobacterium mesophilicum]
MNFSPSKVSVLLRAKICLGLAFGAMAVSPTSAAPMVTGGLTSQPIGHYDFCRKSPAECAIRTVGAAPETMTDALWAELVAVTQSVNKAVQPINDIDLYGKDEVWAYPTEGKGDCEDYVLEKRRELNQYGLSLANLLITVVKKPDGEGHAVLTVRTTDGDFVLDNLSEAVREWEETGYRYLKRQSTENTGRWVAIREGQAPLVGSVQPNN